MNITYLVSFTHAMHFQIMWALVLTLVSLSSAAKCPCGWRLKERDAVYTHRLDEDFSQYPNIKSVLNNPEAAVFNRAWMIYDY